MKTRLLFCLVIFALSFGVKKADAAGYTYTWTGGGVADGNWNNSLNWTGGAIGGFPGAGDNAIIPVITGMMYSPVVNVTSTCSNITISGTATITLAASLTLSSTITMNSTGSTGTFTTSSGFTLKANTLTVTRGTLLIACPTTITGSAGVANIAAGTTLTVNAAVSVANAININGSSTINGTSTLTGATLPFSGSYTLTAGATLISISGAATMNTATVTFVNNASGGSPTLTIGGGITNSSTGTIAFTATNPGTANITGNIAAVGGGTFSVGAGVTMNLYTGSMTESYYGYTWSNAGNITTASDFAINYNTGGGAFTNSGTITANDNMTFDGSFNNSGAITAQNASTFTVGANSTAFTNTGTINVTPNTALTANSSFVISGSGLTFNNTSPGKITVTGITGNTTTLFTISANGGPINNSGSISATNTPVLWSGNSWSAINNTNPGTITLVTAPLTITNNTTFTNTGTISATASPLNLGSASQGITFYNTNPGKITLASSSTLSYPGNSVVFTNTGTIIATSSNLSFTGNVNSITNTSPGNISASGSNITFATGCGITNNASAIFTANGSSAITFSNGSNTAFINNSGIFNAGTANSPCNISTGTSSLVHITNNSGGTFNLGSTSTITLANTSTGNPDVVANSGTFTLESDQYGSASIGTSGTPTGTGTGNINQFTGKFNVQRYLAPGTAGYRLLSSPVNVNTTAVTNGVGGDIGLKYVNSSATIVNPNANVGTVTYNGALTGGPGGTTNGFTTAGAYGNPTMYLYEESKATNNSTYTSGKDIGIDLVGTTTVSTLTGTTVTPNISIPAGNGYFIYYIGTDTLTSYTGSSVSVGTTITAVGALNQQSIIFNYWNAGATGFPATGKLSDASSAPYNLLGNPYPSEIDLKQVYADNSSQGYSTFSQFDYMTQSFVAYNAVTGGTSTPATYRYVASGQGFFVLATGASQTLTFNEDEKVPSTLNSTSTPPIFLSLRNQGIPAGGAAPKTDAVVDPENVLTGLHLEMVQDSTHYHYCGIYFNSKWSDNYNYLDAYDQDGFSPSVYMSSFTADNVRTSINSLGDYTKGKRIKLYVRAIKDGIYHLTISDFQNIDTAVFNIYLIDNQNKDSLDMVHYKTYNFNLSAADTAAFSNRFVLVIEPKPFPPYKLLSFTGENVSSSVQINWATANEGTFTGFGLQKKQANGQYAMIDTLQSNGGGIYNYTDMHPASGSNVYRLEQNDINGNITYSEPITIIFSPGGAGGVFTIYPSPAKEMITVNVNSTTSSVPNYVSNIYDTTGALIAHHAVNTNTWTEDVSAYKPGIYIIALTTNDGNLVGKSKFEKVN